MSYGRLVKRVKRVAARSRLYAVLKKLRGAVRPGGMPELEEVRRTGTVPLPRTFTFEPTLKCNLRCTMCYQNEYRDAGVKPELDTRKMTQLFRGFGRRFRSAYLVGGEVLLRRDFEDLLKVLEQERIEVFFTTNGAVGSPERIARLRRFKNLSGMWFSIDGIGEVHERIRGPRTFNRTVKMVKQARRHFEVGTSFVIMPENVDQMLAYAELAADLDVIEVNFQHEIFSTPDELAETQAMLGWRPDELMVYVKPAARPARFFDTLRDNLAKLTQLERARKIVVSFEPPAANERLEEFYAGTLRRRARLYCREMTNLRIDPQGNVIFCPYLRRSFGNLLETPVDDIWNSEALRRFRMQLLESNLLPICQRCCKLGLQPGDAPAAVAVRSEPAPTLVQIDAGRRS